MVKKLKHSEYVERLKGRKIAVIGKYLNNKSPIDHLCLEKECGHK
ncbi:hypothetical protein [Psychrilyobacter atlanticus]|nr:hypothetical protein [Psychrilyobacter atlanticus]